MGEKRLWLALLAPLLMSCQVIHGLDGYNTDDPSGPAGAGGTDGGPSSTSTSTGSSGGDVPCGQRPGPAMIFIPPGTMGGTVGYCIDSTEVTMGHYNGWVEGTPAPKVEEQPPYCAWNADYMPNLSGNQCAVAPFDPVGKALYPVTCVDWCDAAAYCAWAGKHLCGGIGGDDYTPADVANATVSEWFRACSRAGEKTYPYGDDFDAVSCAEPGSEGGTVSVTAKPKCKGGYPGLFGMSGNAWEWENLCEAWDGDLDRCFHRGGSFWEASGELRCDTASDLHRRNSYNTNIGFRCCADRVP